MSGQFTGTNFSLPCGIWNVDFLGETVINGMYFSIVFYSSIMTQIQGVSFMHVNKYKHMLERFSPLAQLDVNQN